MMETLEEYKQKIKACSEVELEGILKHIDKEKYPDRYQAVVEEMNAREKVEQPICSEQAGLIYAGFWFRFFAMVIDGILFMILFFLVSLSVAAVMTMPPTTVLRLNSEGGRFDVGLLMNRTAVFVNTFLLIVWWLYFAIMESSWRQATWGKFIVGIKVTDLEGQRISFGKATLRHFLRYVSAVLLGLGYLMVAFTKKKQALHDILAGCLVVRRTDGHP